MKNLAALLLLTAVACAVAPHASRETEDQAKRFAAPADDRSTVYIYRTGNPLGGALLTDLWLDGQIAGSLGPREFLTFDVEPGPHSVSLRHAGVAEATSIETPAGSVVFLSFLYGALGLVQIDDETGRKHVAAYRMVEGVLQ